MKILTGTSHPELADLIAKSAGVELCETEITRFPDNEIFVKITENVRGHDLFIIQSISLDPNVMLMELLIMIDAAKRASADRITAVLPYYGYARQDRKDQPRVPITAKLVANVLVAAGANRILCMDVHAAQIQGFFDIPVDHLFGSAVIVNYIRSLNLDDLVIVSPDAGGLKTADMYANLLGAGIALVGKQRKSSEDVEANHLVGDVRGRNVVLVDDMTSTAGTLTAAAKLLEDAEAKSIRAAVSHSLLLDKGLMRLKESSIIELITTNSIPQQKFTDINITVLSVADLLAEAITRIHGNQSVSSLFADKS
ncbi:MAG: ribose-phosphate diphosphokinase [Pontiellaceae bacterium]